MRMDRSFARRGLIVGLGVLLLFIVLPACSDDPILGPNDGSPDDDGGSYSSINRLAPPASAVDSSASTGRAAQVRAPTNPERF